MDDLGRDQQLQRGASSSSEGGHRAWCVGARMVREQGFQAAHLIAARLLCSFYPPCKSSVPRPLPAPPKPAELFRAASFNTKVGVLRSQSPFYRMQEPPSSAPGSSSSSGPSSAAATAAAAAAAAEGIELKPASANVLLGQAHLEGRGRFLPAHPVPHLSPGAAVRRGPSPLQRAASPEEG